MYNGNQQMVNYNGICCIVHMLCQYQQKIIKINK